MIFTILTLLTALGLAAVAGWFSIIGVMAIFAAFPVHALVMGIALECGKLVTTSWLYRNWETASLTLKIPLIVFTMTLMLATSMGVFGFLSKAHLEQASSTVDNFAKVERLEQQIAREKSVIADNEKVITQLDATVNSYLGKDRADRSLSVRKSQAPQRTQLRADIDAAQKKIDQFSDEKLALQSEVRKLQLEVGPIRYIAELIYGTDNSEKNIESAVRIFILLIVSTFDPLAVILLIAANHSIMKLRRKPDDEAQNVARAEPTHIGETSGPAIRQGQTHSDSELQRQESVSTLPGTAWPEIHYPLSQTKIEIHEEAKVLAEDTPVLLDINEDKEAERIQDVAQMVSYPGQQDSTAATEAEELRNSLSEMSRWFKSSEITPAPAAILQPTISRVSEEDIPVVPNLVPANESSIRELLGSTPHFIPVKVNEEAKPKEVEEIWRETGDKTPPASSVEEEITQMAGARQEIDQGQAGLSASTNKSLFPRTFSWLKEFKRT